MRMMGERLREARHAAGYESAMSAAKKFGWSPSTYAAHENGQNGFNIKAAAKYAKAFKTTAAWLLTEEGEPPRKKAPLIGSFDPDVPDRRIGDLEQPAEFDPDAQPDAGVFPHDAIKELVPLGGMGTGQTLQSVYRREDGGEIVQQDPIKDDYWRFPASFIRGVVGTTAASLIVVECTGDSMEPTLSPNERVWVNTSHKMPSPDGIYAIRDPLEQVVVKRLELVAGQPPRIRVISDNPRHEPKEYSLGEVSIVGKVVAGLRLF